ncbi:DNA-binding transcriptional regulator YbjK [Lipingzhangella halophila]|uniref:DNA-binding transcriptional regulator YbjK n=1 Tax=Lipingzhangella halophila TaxID=1783352 RepID=A0A7W7RI13_9ACTN|nr:TetR/AcrR family transcriptional regulator [Lipingzhangella halophila]MBB4932372.1 DNA-binding transcriptional regulator YbjK [Lipingzhangella halophila]
MRPRVELIARTAVSIIAQRGLRGLTHRAVDEAAGLPPGSTSYHARTRVRLIETALTWLAEEDEQDLGEGESLDPGSAGGAAALIAEFTHSAVARDPDRTRARLELALEAGRNPDLRAVYDRIGARFRGLAERLMRELGSPEPARHARTVIAWMEGMAFDSLAGSGAAAPPSRSELHEGAAELLRALLPASRPRES